jgi:hypothetical protein
MKLFVIPTSNPKETNKATISYDPPMTYMCAQIAWDVKLAQTTCQKLSMSTTDRL